MPRSNNDERKLCDAVWSILCLSNHAYDVVYSFIIGLCYTYKWPGCENSETILIKYHPTKITDNLHVRCKCYIYATQLRKREKLIVIFLFYYLNTECLKEKQF